MSRFQTAAAVLAVAALAGVGYVLFFEGKKPEPAVPSMAGYSPRLVEKPVVAGEESADGAAGNGEVSGLAPEHQQSAASRELPADAAAAATDASDAEAAGSPPVRVNRSWSQIEDDFREVHSRNTTDVERGRLLEEMYQALTHPSFTGSTDFPSHCAELGKWRDEFPESPLPLVVLATAHIEWAWEARGTGAAITVTDEGWKLFHTRIDEARRLAQKALDLGARDAEPYRALITIGMADGTPNDQLRRVFDQGQKIDPLYIRLYSSFAVALLPRWGGEPGDVEKFANQIPSLVPGDDGLAIMGEVVLLVHRYECNDPVTILWGQYDRKLLAQAADVVAQRYPKAQPMVQFAAMASWICQDHAVAKRVRPLVQEFDLNFKIFLDKQSLAQFMNWADCESVPSGEHASFWASLHGCTGLAFADNSRHVWVGHQVGSRAITLMDSETGQIALAVPNLAGIITSAAANQRQGIAALATFRPDTKVVAFDLDQPRLPLEFATKGRADHLLVNPARKQLAWRENADRQQVRLLDLTAEPLATVDIATDGASDIVYSADGEIIAINRSLGSSLHDAKTGERLVTLPGFRERPPPAYLCEKILAIDEEHFIWAIVRRHPQADFCLARYAPDAQSATMIVEGLKDSFPFVLSPDRTLLALVTPKDRRQGPYEIDVIEVPSGKQLAHFGGHWNNIGKLAFSPDSRKLASVALMSDVVKIWSLDTLEPANEPSPTPAAESPAISE